MMYTKKSRRCTSFCLVHQGKPPQSTPCTPFFRTYGNPTYNPHVRTRIRDSDFAVHAVLSRRFAWQTRRNRVHQWCTRSLTHPLGTHLAGSPSCADELAPRRGADQFRLIAPARARPWIFLELHPKHHGGASPRTHHFQAISTDSGSNPFLPCLARRSVTVMRVSIIVRCRAIGADKKAVAGSGVPRIGASTVPAPEVRRSASRRVISARAASRMRARSAPSIASAS